MRVPPDNLIDELRRLTDEVESLITELSKNPTEERLREVAPAWMVTRERLIDVTQAIADEVTVMLDIP